MEETMRKYLKIAAVGAASVVVVLIFFFACCPVAIKIV